MRLCFILILLSASVILSSCGTVAGTVHGLGDDLINLIKLGYEVL
ncbi:MAG: hypothetical protein P8M50_06510 [Paracoccaceae bacterium]|nr:hypothetical protein [Paracoccaceae bacterium]